MVLFFLTTLRPFLNPCGKKYVKIWLRYFVKHLICFRIRIKEGYNFLYDISLLYRKALNYLFEIIMISNANNNFRLLQLCSSQRQRRSAADQVSLTNVNIHHIRMLIIK